MNIGVYFNPEKDRAQAIISKISQAFSKHSLAIFSSSNIEDFENKKIDFMIVVGGDGTILRIVPYCVKRDIVIAGINLGSVGFLTEIEIGEIDKIIDLIATNQIKVENRSVLVTKYAGKQYTALNDIVLLKNGDGIKSRVVKIAAYVGQTQLDTYVCDGVICCTPTGSTAYSLSCGGAVLDPQLQAFEVVAICPHSLHAKPIVLPSSEIIRFVPCQSVSVIIDGTIIGNTTEEISIRTYEKQLKLFKNNDSSFYTKLLEKLTKWSAKS